MDKIINYLLLIIIFVFDPLAIALVIAANFAFEQAKTKEDDLKDWDNTSLDGLEFEPWDEFEKEEFEPWDEFEKEEFEPLIQEELAPQQEFDILDTNKDGIVDDEERAAAQTKIEAIESDLQNTSLSGWRANKMRQEAEELKNKIIKDDNIIDYN